MAYTTPETNRRRIIALAGVGAVHGVMAVALLTGFAGGIIQEFKRKTIQSWNYMPPPQRPVPEPPVKPTVQKHDRLPLPDPLPPLPPMGDPGLTIDTGPLPPIGSGLGGGIEPPLPTSSPTPHFTPRAAAPLPPSGWRCAPRHRHGRCARDRARSRPKPLAALRHP